MTQNTENSFGTGSDSEILRVREYNIDTLHYRLTWTVTERQGHTTVSNHECIMVFLHNLQY